MNSWDGASPAQTRARIEDVLVAVGAELRGIEEIAMALQSVLDCGPPLNVVRNIESLQSIDLLTQRIAGLSSFVALLTRDVDAGCHADIGPALATIGLSDMASRLSAGSLGAGPPTPPSGLIDSGALDLF